MTRPFADPPRLQPLTRARVADLGEPGAAWHAGLSALLDGLAQRWGLTLGRPLPGGSASYVLTATTAAGEPRVLKVRLPDPTLADEARVLRAAHGCGYARLHGHVAAAELGVGEGGDALLLEHLGPTLDAAGGAPPDRLRVVARTLREAWAVEPPPLVPRPEDKAVSLARSVRETDARLGGVTDPGVLRAALAAADRLAGWDGPEVTVHGDPHLSNLLRAPDARGTGWVFVDPDGFPADPAHDLGVALRDWVTTLAEAGSGARALHESWCRLVAEETDLDAGRVRDWALLERVSTGLYVCGFGADRVGRPYLESARALV
ncbi:aminoglycoside phosphotransferase family protein [Nocardioides sp. GY 10127]|uniref:aminoglycoside phosphotransferase family protein n=1 Tax=Nocardioides sp. GY 10127 TaxID=2569762 RepID=UPI00145909C5|nr:aminoglycoside phosphotransferase family protein [Nocardioides sp. GY 10127]